MMLCEQSSNTHAQGGMERQTVCCHSAHCKVAKNMIGLVLQQQHFLRVLGLYVLVICLTDAVDCW
jgi:hypothetical protein